MLLTPFLGPEQAAAAALRGPGGEGDTSEAPAEDA
jgi:hypothetical protein